MLRNIGSNWALSLIQIAVLMQLTPVQVRALGVPAQGAWLTVASLTSALGLLILGVPMASVRFVAGHVARNEIDRANRAIATCLGICLALGAVAVAVGAGLSFFFEHTYLRSDAWRALGPRVLHEARVAYWLMVVQVGLGFAAQLPLGVLEARNEFVGRNGVKIAGLLLRLGLVAGALRVWPSLILLGVIQIVCMVVELAAALFILRRSLPSLHFGLGGFERGRVREILGFSIFAMLLGLGSQLAFQCDQLVISASGGPEQGTYFDVGNKFFPPLLGIVIGIGAVVMPAATHLQAAGDLAELRRVFLKWSKVASSMTLLVGVYLLVLGPEFIAWWMGPAFAGPSGRVARVLAAGFLVFLPVRGVASPLLMGLGKPAVPALSFLAMGVVNLALSLCLAPPLGIVGVALGTAVPGVVFASLVAVRACRELGIPFLDYVRYVFVRPSLGALLPALALASLARGVGAVTREAPRWVAAVPLVVFAAVLAALFAAVWALWVCRDDPYLDPLGRLDRFVPAARSRRTP